MRFFEAWTERELSKSNEEMEKLIIEYVTRNGDWYTLRQRIEPAALYPTVRNLPQDVFVKRLSKMMQGQKVMWVVSARVGVPACRTSIL